MPVQKITNLIIIVLHARLMYDNSIFIEFNFYPREKIYFN
jgi:hypothetical protein